MKQLNQYWLCISIFYSRNQWHSLFNNWVSPYLNSLIIKNCLSGYIYCFNSEQGENIRITLKIKRERLKFVHEDLYKNVNLFFIRHPSKTSVPEMPLDEFLLHFPNNSIQYNLFDPISTKDLNLLQFFFDYSMIIGLAFSKSKVQEKTLFDLAFNSVLALLFYVPDESFNKEVFFKKNMTDLYKEIIPNNADYIKNFDFFFESNKVYLMKIFSEIQAERSENLDKNEIRYLLNQSINKFYYSQFQLNPFQLTTLARNMIFQLGLKQDLIYGLIYLSQKCYKSYYPKKTLFYEIN